MELSLSANIAKSSNIDIIRLQFPTSFLIRIASEVYLCRVTRYDRCAAKPAQVITCGVKPPEILQEMGFHALVKHFFL